MAEPTLVEFPIQVKVSDIVGKLRQLADKYESGTDPLPDTFMFIEVFDGDMTPIFGAFGDCPSNYEVAGILSMVMHDTNVRLKKV